MKFGARLIQILAVSVVASSLLTTFTSSLVLAQGEGTTVGTFELTATFECISVYANFSGDDNGNNQATLEYREVGGSWKQGMTLTVDRRQTIYDRLYYNFGVGPNPFANQWRGSVLGLRPNTQYEVRVIFTDPDGVIGTNPISGTIRTRNDNFPQGTGNTYYVATSGNDSNPGTETLPWRTIQKAANIVSTGDTVYIKAGTYVESITLTRSGAANNYITFMNYGSDNVIIDGNNATDVFLLDGASYIKIHGLTLRDASDYVIRCVRSANYNVIENNTIYDFGYSVPDGGIVITLRSAYNLIQNNYIYNTSNRSGYGDNRHRASGISLGFWCGYADGFYGPGPGQVIRYNKIQGGNDWNTGALGHGITGEEHDDIQNGFYKDCDVYGNEILGVNSDGIGCEAGDINCRVWGNFVYNTFTNSFGLGPCKIGPLYVFRNVVCTPESNSGQELGVKMGWGPISPTEMGDYGGEVYFYHNTIYIPRYVSTLSLGVADWGGQYARSQHYRNNIIYVSRWPIILGVNASSSNVDFDYDILYNANRPGEYLVWKGINYSGLPSFQAATGQEMHGINANPQFVDPANSDLTLQATSLCIDKGVLLPGFNDANSAWSYKGSAPDMGAFEYPSYRLSLDVTPSSITTIRGEGWYVAGTEVYTGTAPDNIPTGIGTRYTFSTWLVDNVERIGNPISITMNSLHKATARYKIQYYLGLESEYGSLQSSGWYDAGTVVSTGIAQETITDNTGTRYVFSSWIVNDVERAGNPVSITMDTPHKVTTRYKIQHYLTIKSKYGNPQGGSWYDSGSTAEISVPSTVGVIVQHLFINWSGDLTETTPVVSVPMDKPKAIVANWRTDYSRLYVVIGVILVFACATLVILIKRKRRA